MRSLIRFAAAIMAVGLAVVPVSAAQASPLSERQWWIDSWAVERLVWPRTTGEGVTVAVIDSGVQANLPDLRGVVLPGKSFGSSGDGRRDIAEEGEFGHGTGMASLIAAQGTATGFTGMAPDAKILPIASRGIDGDTGPKQIRYAVNHGADVIYVSWSTPAGTYKYNCPPDMLDAVAYAAKNDVIMVAAAGDFGHLSNFVQYPASCPGVVAVGAMDNRGNAWERTQRHDYVALSAPGVNIPALSQDGRVWPDGNGTSHAAALASGAFALLRSEFPQKSAREIVQLAINTAKDFGPEGKDKRHGYGTLSLRTALSEDVAASAPNPVYERLDMVLAAQAKASATPSASPTLPAASTSDDDLGSIGRYLVIGLAVAVVTLLVLVVALLLMLRSRRRRPQAPAGSVPPGFGQGSPPGGGTPPRG